MVFHGLALALCFLAAPAAGSGPAPACRQGDGSWGVCLLQTTYRSQRAAAKGQTQRQVHPLKSVWKSDVAAVGAAYAHVHELLDRHEELADRVRRAGPRVGRATEALRGEVGGALARLRRSSESLLEVASAAAAGRSSHKALHETLHELSAPVHLLKGNLDRLERIFLNVDGRKSGKSKPKSRRQVVLGELNKAKQAAKRARRTVVDRKKRKRPFSPVKVPMPVKVPIPRAKVAKQAVVKKAGQPCAHPSPFGCKDQTLATFNAFQGAPSLPGVRPFEADIQTGKLETQWGAKAAAVNKTEHAKEAWNARHAGCAQPTPFGCKDQAEIQTGKLETAQGAKTAAVKQDDQANDPPQGRKQLCGHPSAWGCEDGKHTQEHSRVQHAGGRAGSSGRADVRQGGAQPVMTATGIQQTYAGP